MLPRTPAAGRPSRPKVLVAAVAALLVLALLPVGTDRAGANGYVCPDDDPREQDDALGAAKPLERSELVNGIICTDDDWSTIWVPGGAMLQVDLTFADVDGDVDLVVTDAGGAGIAASTSVTDDESVTVPIASSGWYGIRVYGFADASNSYGLTATFGVCPPDDPTEPDDLQEDATPLTAGTTVHGIACDEDWYSFAGVRGQRVTVDLGGNPAAGDVHVLLRAPAGHVMNGGLLSDGPPAIETVLLETGTFFLSVGGQGAPNVYALDLAVDPSPCGGEYPDVTTVHPFCPEISMASHFGWVGGYADGTFRPSNLLSRQAFAAMLYRFFGASDSPPATATFPDVPTSHPFFAEIEWMAKNGYANGYADGTFRPGGRISRQALAAFIYRATGFDIGATTPTFTDVPLSHPFSDAIEWLAWAEFVSGYADGGFHPVDPVSRQAIAAILSRWSNNS